MFKGSEPIKTNVFLIFSKPPKNIKFWILASKRGLICPPLRFSKIQVLPRRRQGGLMEGSQKNITGPGGPRAYKIQCFFDFFEKQRNHFFATLSAKNDPIWLPLEFFNNSRRHKSLQGSSWDPRRASKHEKDHQAAPAEQSTYPPPLRSSISYC